MAIKLRKWDSAEHLKTEDDMQAYLQACIEESNGDAAFIAKALGNIAKAKGLAQLSRDTGLGRESLTKHFLVMLTEPYRVCRRVFYLS